MRESDILHESPCGRFWIGRERLRGRPIIRLFENRNAGGALVRGTFDFRDDEPRALAYAQRDMARRLAAADQDRKGLRPWAS